MGYTIGKIYAINCQWIGLLFTAYAGISAHKYLLDLNNLEWEFSGSLSPRLAIYINGYIQKKRKNYIEKQSDLWQSVYKGRAGWS